MKRRNLLGDLLCGHEILGDVVLLQKLINLESCLFERLGQLMLCDAALPVELDKSRFLRKPVEIGVVSPQLLFHAGGEVKRNRHWEAHNWKVLSRHSSIRPCSYLSRGLLRAVTGSAASLLRATRLIASYLSGVTH